MRRVLFEAGERRAGAIWESAAASPSHESHGYALFLEKLAESVETFRVSLRAFCLKPNHVHL